MVWTFRGHSWDIFQETSGYLETICCEDVYRERQGQTSFHFSSQGTRQKNKIFEQDEYKSYARNIFSFDYVFHLQFWIDFWRRVKKNVFLLLCHGIMGWEDIVLEELSKKWGVESMIIDRETN